MTHLNRFTMDEIREALLGDEERTPAFFDALDEFVASRSDPERAAAVITIWCDRISHALRWKDGSLNWALYGLALALTIESTAPGSPKTWKWIGPACLQYIQRIQKDDSRRLAS